MTEDDKRRLADLNDEAAQLLEELQGFSWVALDRSIAESNDLRKRICLALNERKDLKAKQLQEWQKKVERKDDFE